MTSNEYTQQQQAIKQEADRQFNELNERFIEGRLYPDGFILRRRCLDKETATGAEWASGPIVDVTIAGDDLYYHVRITQPADYRGPKGSPRLSIEMGKYESFWQRHLLEGTGPDGEIPQQPFNQITRPYSDIE